MLSKAGALVSIHSDSLRHIASNYENTGKPKKTTEAQTTSLNTAFKLILQLVVSGTQKNTVKNNELLFSALPERCSLWLDFKQKAELPSAIVNHPASEGSINIASCFLADLNSGH